jgi:hypothetical protein
MTFKEAVATHAPAWVGIWLNILLLGAIVLPLSLFIWKQTRLVALAALIAGIAGIVGVMTMYGQMGYVRLLGLPHIIMWTPLAFFLVHKLRSPDVTPVPRVIMGVVLATIAVSLAFDVLDVVRYISGDRTPLAMASTLP